MTMARKISKKEEEFEKKKLEQDLMKEEAHQLEMQEAYEADEEYEESED
jgi:hypothetical protein